MKIKLNLFILIFLTVLFTVAQQHIVPPRNLEKYNSKSASDPCLQTFLNNEPIACGNSINRKIKGIITASKDNINKIYFNVTVKSYCGKNEPPIYLRFIKVKQIDIQELLQYTQDGDEIFIEEFIPATNKIDLSCSPANFYVQSNL